LEAQPADEAEGGGWRTEMKSNRTGNLLPQWPDERPTYQLTAVFLGLHGKILGRSMGLFIAQNKVCDI